MQSPLKDKPVNKTSMVLVIALVIVLMVLFVFNLLI